MKKQNAKSKSTAKRAPKAKAVKRASATPSIKGTEGGAKQFLKPSAEVPAGYVHGTRRVLDPKGPEVARMRKLRNDDPSVFTYKRLALIFGLAVPAVTRFVTFGKKGN